MKIPPYLLFVTVVFGAAGILPGSIFAATGEIDNAPAVIGEEVPYRDLQIRFKGLPAGEGDNILLMETIRLQDTVVSMAVTDSAYPEIYSAVPAEPSLFVARYFSFSPPLLLEGSAGIRKENSVNVTMNAPITGGYPAHGTLPTYPPDRGITIGYNPADFTVTGPDYIVDAFKGGALADLVTVDLVMSRCSDDSSTPYEVVESANPRIVAIVEAEIALQSSPLFDPATRVIPHFLAATHLAKGSANFDQGNVIINLRVEDRQGHVKAQANVSGPEDNFSEMIDEAVSSLANQICTGETELGDWSGILKVESSGSYTGKFTQDPGAPTASISGTMFMECRVAGTISTCHITGGGKISGRDGSLEVEVNDTVEPDITIQLAENMITIHIGLFTYSQTVKYADQLGQKTDTVTEQGGGWTAEGAAGSDLGRQSGIWTSEDFSITWELSRE